MMPRITLQQTLGALPNHRKRLFSRGLQAASVMPCDMGSPRAVPKRGQCALLPTQTPNLKHRVAAESRTQLRSRHPMPLKAV
jgi:hypothetical protein